TLIAVNDFASRCWNRDKAHPTLGQWSVTQHGAALALVGPEERIVVAVQTDTGEPLEIPEHIRPRGVFGGPFWLELEHDPERGHRAARPRRPDRRRRPHRRRRAPRDPRAHPPPRRLRRPILARARKRPRARPRPLGPSHRRPPRVVSRPRRRRAPALRRRRR